MAVFHVNFMSESLGRTVPLCVILPADKVYFGDMPRREEGKPYKTLYLLHGIIGSHIDWLYGTRIQRYAEEHDLAVVMPAGENGFYVDQPWNLAMYSGFVQLGVKILVVVVGYYTLRNPLATWAAWPISFAAAAAVAVWIYRKKGAIVFREEAETIN